jgi:hypothetical protein
VNDVRSVLEGIAYGRDERITPGDRLRAVEQLRELAPERPLSDYEREIREWDEGTLNREVDDLCAEEIADAVWAEDGSWPRLAALLRAKVEERARELADAGRIEAEIERLATKRARWLFEREIGTQPMLTETAVVDAVARDKDVVGPRRLVPPPPGVEPEAGFRRRRSRVGRSRLERHGS